jgi:uncharacterized membrane protein YphA (DoxX/SURF4 family)
MSSLPPIPGDPVSPLAYAMPFSEARLRPGLITAVGIISIVVGSLSALGSLSGAASAVVFMTMSKIKFPPPPPAVPATMPASTSVVTFTATATTAPTPTSVVPFGFKIDPRASILMIVEAVLSLGVAVLLIVAGSLLLRNSPRALRLHWIYVILKLPLIVLAAVATWWTYTGMMNSMSAFTGAATPPGFGNTMAAFQAIFAAVFSLLYPIALLFVLRTRTAREYFKKISRGVAA